MFLNETVKFSVNKQKIWTCERTKIMEHPENKILNQLL